MQKLENILPKISLSTSYSPVIFPICLKHSLISIENKSVDISILIPFLTDKIAAKALFSASKCLEFVTIVSLLLSAPLFTREVKCIKSDSTPIFSLAESNKISSISVRISFFLVVEIVSILLAITKTLFLGKRFLIVAISDRKTSLDVENLLE